ncbi:hypothetical protein Agabi119p4_4529 [Agaricus bisporus var. burnettii]|uniref:Uncharacterized protein n=1 Tax=Agaricus bisporus var. burnettii TaxID=192524 RepID=A0A8H7F3G0_AGABI|nr:hypothetical protein Agabi119p4_4529 [Agaricus bisporus var. burnettii]
MPTDLVAPGEGLETLSPVNIVRGTHGQLIAFLVLNAWPAHFGLPVLLAIVFFSKKIYRHITFINLCVVFIIIGISASLLFYDGSIEGPEPSRMLCLWQASLLYGMPGLSSTAVLMLVLYLFLVIRAHYNGTEYLDREHYLQVLAMSLSPYVVYMIFVIATAIIGANNPERVSRSRRFFYCSLDFLPLTNALTIVSATILFVTFVLEVWTAVMLIKQYKIRRDNIPEVKKLDISLPIRIIIFGFYVIIAMSLSLLSTTSPESPVPDLMIASGATVVLLIFGTQKDILGVLFFRKMHTSSPVRRAYSIDLKSEFSTP